MTLFGLGRKKILVVEDHKQLAEGLEARLNLEGYDVVRAADGREGVDFARSQKPDLVILDLMLPKIDGFEACKMLKAEEKTKKIPILVLTALQTLGDTDDAFASGADDFISKPFNSDRLLEKIRKLLVKESARYD